MDLYEEIDKRAKVLVEDNLLSLQSRIRAGDADFYIEAHFLELIKAAMNIGASIMFENGVPLIPGEVEDDVLKPQSIPPLKHPMFFQEKVDGLHRGWVLPALEKI